MPFKAPKTALTNLIPNNMAKSSKDKLSEEAVAVAREQLLHDITDDFYNQRKRVYRVNFLRGIFFGLGSALGGTLVLATIAWVLSWFVNWPLVEQIVDALKSK